jgi:hypothetical protein
MELKIRCYTLDIFLPPLGTLDIITYSCYISITYHCPTHQFRISEKVGDMSNSTIKIYRKDSARGEDGYKTFSVRIKEETVAALDGLATKSNRSRNELINIILEHAANNIEVVE